MIIKNSLNKITILPIRERVASELRNAIFSGSFSPGEELRQDEIAQRLGVSRMPVREALQILSGEGLVEFRKNRGAIVRNISKDYIREHFEVRLILECEAVVRACTRMTDLARLEYIHEEQRKAIETNDIDGTNLCNLAFHKHIWDNAGNTKLEAILENLWNGLSIGTVVVPAVHMHKSYDEHGLIIKAIEERKPEDARSIMSRHIQRSLENMVLRPSDGSE